MAKRLGELNMIDPLVIAIPSQCLWLLILCGRHLDQLESGYKLGAKLTPQ